MKLNLQSIVVYGKNCPSAFEWIKQYGDLGWFIHISIRFTMKRETKTCFRVDPPLYIPNKKRKALSFKTSSYKDLKAWLKKHENILKK